MTASSSSRGGGSASIRRIKLPDVVGLDIDNAKVVLSNAGFHRFKLHYTEDYVADFSVVDQYPRSGLLIHRDSEVTLKVCRQSVVQYLPQVYQQTALDGASFLKGFLYITQTIQDQIGFRLKNIHELFDPRTADPEFLPWLASWLAITLNPDWTALQRRKMLMAATRLFPIRGTAMAVREFVRIYTGASVEIEENAWPFNGFRIGAYSTVGTDTVILPPMNLAHCFIVRLDQKASETAEDEIIRIHQIIQAQKPAHTAYFLSFSDEDAAGEMGSFMTIGGSDPASGLSLGIGLSTDGEPFAVIAAPDYPAQDFSEAAADPAKAEDDAKDEAADKKTPKVAAKPQPKVAAKPRQAKSDAADKKTPKVAAKPSKSSAKPAEKSAKAADDAKPTPKVAAKPKPKVAAKPKPKVAAKPKASAKTAGKTASKAQAKPADEAKAKPKPKPKVAAKPKAGAAKAKPKPKVAAKPTKGRRGGATSTTSSAKTPASDKKQPKVAAKPTRGGASKDAGTKKTPKTPSRKRTPRKTTKKTPPKE